MCNKSVNTYPSTIWLVLEYYKAQVMYDKAVNTSFSVFSYMPDWYKTQEMCDRVASIYHFKLKLCYERCKLQNVW